MRNQEPGFSKKLGGKRPSPLTPLPITGEGNLAGFENFLQNDFDIGEDFFISETYDAIFEFFKLTCSLFIFFFLCVVDAAIQFHNQPSFRTVEICNERA